MMRLKNYVFFRESEDGVWFDAGTRSFTLKGAGLYPLVERILALMEAQAESAEALLALLPPKLHPLAGQLLQALREHEMLLEAAAPEPDAAPGGHGAGAELQRYLEDRLPAERGRSGWARWRGAAVAAIGDGYALKGAALALAESGCGTLRVFVCGRDTVVAASEIESALGDSQASVTAGSPAAEDLADVDLLVFASDSADSAEEALRWDGLARGRGLLSVCALPLQDILCVAPPGERGLPGLADLADTLRPAADEAETPSPAALSLMGGIAAHHSIEAFFGIDEEARRGRANIVTPDLDVVAAAVLPSPRVRREEGGIRPFAHLSRFEVPEGRVLTSYEELRLSLDPWFDERTGPFRRIEDKAVPQVPLYHDLINVTLPGDGREQRRCVGWGLDAEQAGAGVLERAVAALAVAEFGEGLPLVAAGTARWEEAAYAAAAIRSDRFRAAARSHRIDVEGIDDPVVALLMRILRFHSGDPVELRLDFVPGQKAFRVEALVAGRPAALAVGPGLVEAVREAVGRAASGFQMAPVAGPDFWAPAAGGRASGEASPILWSDLAALAAGEERWPFRLHRSSLLGLPETVSCGYAELDPAA